MGNRGGPSSSDIFDRVERAYACANTATPGKPHLRRTGNTWGVSPPLGGNAANGNAVPHRLNWRGAAYEWCCRMNALPTATIITTLPQPRSQPSVHT